jgi:hypothetical protein
VAKGSLQAAACSTTVTTYVSRRAADISAFHGRIVVVDGKTRRPLCLVYSPLDANSWTVASVIEQAEIGEFPTLYARVEFHQAGPHTASDSPLAWPFFKLCTNVANNLLDATSAPIGSSASCSAVHVHQTTTGIGSTSGAITCRSCWGLIRRVSTASRPAFVHKSWSNAYGRFYSAYSSPSGP